ncbi:MAG: hydroxymethylbilane synthase [Gammaproteobacteria bacterium]
MKSLKIATRQSELALWQAEHVREKITARNPQLDVELVKITTQGDRILDRPLAKIGGKGLFIKELQLALIDGRADIAVHSMKDVPVDAVDELEIAVILKRADPRDVLVSKKYTSLADLPVGARIGTSSLRRKSQLALLRNDLEIGDLRGNVPTRIRRMEDGDYDAILLAAAGLKRLGLGEKIRANLSVDEMLPAVGQGAIGIECRVGDELVRSVIGPLADSDTGICVTAERALSEKLHGSCEIPIAAHATLNQGKLALAGLVASVDGKRVVSVADECEFNELGDALSLGSRVGEQLLARGAHEIIQLALQQSS